MSAAVATTMTAAAATASSASALINSQTSKPGLLSRPFLNKLPVSFRSCSRNGAQSSRRVHLRVSSSLQSMVSDMGRAGCSCLNGFSVGKTHSTQRRRRKRVVNGINRNLQFCNEDAEASHEFRDHRLSEIKGSTNGQSSKTPVKCSGFAKSCKSRPVPRVFSFSTRIQQERSLQQVCRCSSNDHNEAKLADKAAEDEIVDNIGVQMALALLRFYKRELSPYIPASCRYVPTCSEYAQQAYKKFGFAKGCILTAWRLLRCNPLGSSGFDPPRWFGEEKPPQV